MSKELEELEELNYNLDLTKTTTYINHYYDIKQALQQLESIENSNTSEALECINGKIADLEDDLQHYTMVIYGELYLPVQKDALEDVDE